MLLTRRAVRCVANRFRWISGEVRYLLWLMYDWLLTQLLDWKCGPRRVLLVVTNELALKSLAYFRDVLEKNPCVSFTVTHSPRVVANRELIENWCRAHSVAYVPFWRARWCPWHLMAFADHDQMDRFPVCVPKVFIGHGIYGSKLIDGVPYLHDPHWIEHRGRVFYTRMFESSDYAVECAIRHNPDLRGIAVAVGNLDADRVFALVSEREQIRAGMGYGSEDLVILLQSTYGETSLMESIGRELIAACAAGAAEHGWKFILQTHPHHWTGPYAEEHPYGNVLLEREGERGITVLHHDEDWAPHMIASDMVITDHTSLSMTYALFGKPMLFVEVPGTTLIEGNPGERLARILPKLSDPDNLVADIERAMRDFPREQVADIAKDILSYLGEAAQRVRTEAYQLLRVEVDANVPDRG